MVAGTSYTHHSQLFSKKNLWNKKVAEQPKSSQIAKQKFWSQLFLGSKRTNLATLNHQRNVSRTFSSPTFLVDTSLVKTGLVENRDDHAAGVDSGRSLHFSQEPESESIFWVRAGQESEPESSLKSVQAPINIFKGPNICNHACCCQTEWT